MKKKEFEFLRDKCLLFNEFMEKKMIISSEIINAFKNSNDLIIKACENRHTKILREGNREVDLQIRELPLYLALELDKLFQEKLGISIDSINKKMEKEIQKVIKRGKILNEEEYRLIKNREDEIYVDNSKAEEKQQLDRLMEAYEESTGANNV